jgi:tetratricopeptide (TPR) repeat protein/transcriptional regulator with XRE-family HTH domain
VAGQPGLSFAGLVRQLRGEAGLTQEELAQAAGLPVRTLSDLERGVSRTAHQDTAGRLAGALGLAGPVRELFVAVARGKAAAAQVMAARRREVPGGFAAAAARSVPRDIAASTGRQAGRRGGRLAERTDPADLQARVLAGDPALAVPVLPASAPVRAAAAEIAAVAGVVPRQLPAGAGFFAGREAELKQLDALLGQVGGEDGADEPGGTVVISAVAGMAGVGKTALAVHWARKVAGRFPGGQLYVNLRGYDPGPAVRPEEAAGWFLAALGVPAAQIPAEAQPRFGLYRSVLAGRRVLIVLDNARDAAQVRPLLPGSPGCLVIVTSRCALAGLAVAEGARPLRLGLMAAEEAVRLVAARLGPERVAAEPGAVTELAARCGYLPLALAVMAARAAADPGLPLGVLAGRLARASAAGAAAAGQPPGREGEGRLEVLETGDPPTSLRDLLSWSHRQLPGPAAAMFAVLGVHCGPDITVPAAASLAGITRAGAGRALAELADASLAAEHRPGRYVMHDLVRGYAAEHARTDLGDAGIRAAVRRSLDHYLHTMNLSWDLPRVHPFPPPAPGVEPEQLADARWHDWVNAERQVLLQAITQAASAGLVTHAWQLLVCEGLQDLGEGYWADWQDAGQAVLAAAEAAGDHTGAGWAHAIIGQHAALAGAHDQGRAHLAQALDHFRHASDLPGQAWVLFYLARPDTRNAGWAEAAALCEQSLVLFRRAGDQGGGERWALAGLGTCHAHLGNYELACGYARQALELDPEGGDPLHQARTYGLLGLVHSRLGEHRQAISAYQQALAAARAWRAPLSRRVLAGLLANFGDACQAAGDPAAARQAWQQALQVLHDLGLLDNRRIRARLEQASQPHQPG